MSILQLLVSGNTSIVKDNTCSSKWRKYLYNVSEKTFINLYNSEIKENI